MAEPTPHPVVGMEDAHPGSEKEREKEEVISSSSPTDLGNTGVGAYPEGGLRAWLVVFGSFCGM